MPEADLPNPARARWHKNRPACLTATLFLLLLVYPATESWSFRGVVLSGLFSLVLLSSALSVARSRRMLITVLCVGIPGMLLSWLARLTDVNWVVTLLTAALLVGCWLLVIVMMLANILATQRVSANTLFRAVSAYLLLGVAWAGIYHILVLVDPGAIRPLGPGSSWGEFVYFSFTSLTTLGYGDITPVSPFAKSLVVVESVVGPMYLAILVARLVALYEHSKSDGDPKET
jgi:hypothetical protein